MRTLKLTIAYDGTRYAGWQVQRPKSIVPSPQSTEKPTIQGALQEVLQQILREPVTVVGSGRTDAGVHALGQVAHVKTCSSMPVLRLQRALNALLRSDITVTRLEEAPETFHAQRHAVSKRYRYTIVTAPAVLPFERATVHHVWGRLDVSRMRREAQVLTGRHDFRAFCASGSSALQVGTTKTTVRTLSDVQVRRHRDRVVMEFEGDGFLYKMVRGIAGTLIGVGRGRLPTGTMERILRTKDRRLVGPTAPARGLILLNVRYKPV